MAELGDLGVLDYDCLVAVFSHLSYLELLQLSAVCHDLFDLAHSNFLWKECCHSNYIHIPGNFESQYNSDYLRLLKHKVRQDYRWIQGKYTTHIKPFHLHSVRGVAFSPKHPHKLASCGYDASAHIYDVTDLQEPKTTFKASEPHDGFANWQRYSRVKWTSDGNNIVVTSSSLGNLFLFDVESPKNPVKAFERVSSLRLDRTALAPHPTFPYLVAVAGDDRDRREGGDISLVDTRMSRGPIRVMRGIHQHTVRDIEWVSVDTILTASPDGTAKIINLEGRIHTTIKAAVKASDDRAYEGVLSATRFGTTVALGCSGCIEVWNIADESKPTMIESIPVLNDNLPIWRLKYNQRGTLLFAADDAGFVRLYHKELGDVPTHRFFTNLLTHDADVSDLGITNINNSNTFFNISDISLNEEYLASASQSREVGICKLYPVDV